MNVLALDLGTHTGWAAIQRNGDAVMVAGVRMWPHGRFESGTQTFDLQRGESPGMRYLRFDRWLAEMLAMVKPQLVVYEQAYLMPTAHASEIFFGLTTRVLAACASLGIEHQAVNAMKLKKWTAGHGRASKGMMLDAVRSRWPTNLSPHVCEHLKCFDPIHDEADALALLHYTLAELGK